MRASARQGWEGFPAALRPLAALALLVALSAWLTPGFASFELRDGAVHGAMLDVVRHGSKVAILAVGMSLVVATRGVDLSVGAVMAIAGAVAARLASSGAPLGAILAAALGASIAGGMLNGVLVAAARVQPIVATLVLMVCGRGVAQLINGGQVVSFEHAGLVFPGSGRVLGVPAPIIIAGAVFAAGVLLIRRTGLGLLVEAVGVNPAAARAAGVPTGRVLMLVYAGSGLCAGVAGLIAAGEIKAADANRAGLFLELDAILAVVLGGAALTGGRVRLVGAVLGALFIQALTTTLHMWDVSPEVTPVPKALVVAGVCVLDSPVTRSWLARAGSAARRRVRA